MKPTVEPQLQYNLPEHLAAWEMVAGQLRSEVDRASYETWVQPLSSRPAPLVRAGNS